MDVLDRSMTVTINTANKDLQTKDVIDELAVYGYLDDIRCVQKTISGFNVSLASAGAAMDILALSAIQICGNHSEITRPGMVKTYVKVFNLPYELDDDVVRDRIEEYGEILSIRRDKVFGYNNIESGVRTVTMYVESNIPSFMTLGGFTARVWYKSQSPTCRNCNETGHIGSNCPNVVCHRCKGKGHMAKECPEPLVCYKCGQIGHIRRDCVDVLSQSSIGFGRLESTLGTVTTPVTYAAAVSNARVGNTNLSAENSQIMNNEKENDDEDDDYDDDEEDDEDDDDEDDENAHTISNLPVGSFVDEVLEEGGPSESTSDPAKQPKHKRKRKRRKSRK